MSVRMCARVPHSSDEEIDVKERVIIIAPWAMALRRWLILA